MSRTAWDFLWSPTPPWIYVGPGEEERTRWVPSAFYGREGIEVCVRQLRGRKMRTVAALMDEVGAAFQVFDGFGENWYALEEVLCYVDEWLPADAYVVVVEGAEVVLADEPEQIPALLTTFDAVGDFWSRPVDGPEQFRRGPAPFHLLVHVSPGHPEAVERLAEAAAGAGIGLRR